MKVLLNFYPVRMGGGQQVASSFINVISQNQFGIEWYVLVGENSELHQLANQTLPREKIISFKYSYLKRLILLPKLRRVISNKEIDLIYNYGPVLPIPKIPQVVRSVYSNLYFPEIDFWKSYTFFTRLKKKLIDNYRLKNTLKANGIVFENESMKARAISLFKYPTDNTIYIEPSVSLFDESRIDNSLNFLEDEDSFKILYLSSWHLNKNILILPEVAKLFLQQKVKIKFILTINPHKKVIENTLIKKINSLGVNDYFIFVNTIKPNYVHQIVKSCDAMILLSKLECFSSNVIEAFYFGKPILLSNEEWAISAAKNAALFVNRDDPKDIFNKLSKVQNSENLRNDLVKNGKARLKEFNTPVEKVTKQINFLKEIYGKYKIRH